MGQSQEDEDFMPICGIVKIRTNMDVLYHCRQICDCMMFKNIKEDGRRERKLMRKRDVYQREKGMGEFMKTINSKRSSNNSKRSSNNSKRSSNNSTVRDLQIVGLRVEDGPIYLDQNYCSL